jgi:hypothetical protein
MNEATTTNGIDVARQNLRAFFTSFSVFCWTPTGPFPERVDASPIETVPRGSSEALALEGWK